MDRCSCHSQKPYEECCGPLHAGKRAAANALELMRSRYSAYALSLIPYIIETTHRSNPLFKKSITEIEVETRFFCQNTKFTGLEIVQFVDGKSQAYVTFVAHLEQDGHDASFREKSSFVKEKGRWLYKSGVVETPRPDEAWDI